jgi:Sulfotransferase family
MQLSTRHRFAFLCIPKCGSTSVEKAIAPHCKTTLSGHPSLKHVNARKYHRHILPLLHKVEAEGHIETFCIMREPIERIYSWYHYQSRQALSKPGHPGHSRYTGDVTFETFVGNYLSDDRPDYAAIGTQYGFISLPDGSIGVDRLFRLDQMEAVAAYLSQKIGQEIDIPFRNKSPGNRESAERTDKEKAMELPPALLARLQEHLAEDYRIYRSLADS